MYKETEKTMQAKGVIIIKPETLIPRLHAVTHRDVKGIKSKWLTYLSEHTLPPNTFTITTCAYIRGLIQNIRDKSL